MNKLKIFITEFFQVSLVTYLVLLLLETVSPGYVSNVFNLNILLGVVLVSGILMVISDISLRTFFRSWGINKSAEEVLHGFMSVNWDDLYKGLPKMDYYKEEKPKSPAGLKENDWYYMLLVSLGGGGLVYYKTRDLGNLAIVIAVLTGVIILLLSFLIFTENE
jgi:hypothetical protein